MFTTSKAFSQHEVVPDVISKAPGQVLKVTYEDNVKVNLGNTLTPTQVQNMPIQIEWDAHNDGLYTLVMTDPDAPSRQTPQYRECLHWLVINISGQNLSSGTTLTEYVGAGPPEGSGLHRYIFLVYKQSQKLSEDIQSHISENSIEGRIGWNATKFAEAHFLGHPIAANFFQAEYDAYVDELHKRLNH